ncbi:MAG: hypothetical protein J5802_09560 [Butyrivibrio sp.]|nr:hypothetical protein [Butyrivibrio sp.]
MSEKVKKRLFYILAAVAFLSVFIYTSVTPHMADDINYKFTVSEANNFFDLFVQEYEHYMLHGGRSVAHFMLRVFLYIGNKTVFNVCAGLVFMLQSLLIYANIDMKKKYDVRVYALILGFLWLLDPAMSQTVFWEDGACNYLFTTTIILGFMTCFRKFLELEKKNTIKLMIGMAVLGLLAGWGNENTSGGAIFFVLCLLFFKWREKKNFSFVKPWMICGLVSGSIGFVIQILSPGNSHRSADAADEEHAGELLAYPARFLKVVLNIKNNYLILILMLVIMLILIRYMCVSKEKYNETTRFMKLMGVTALITDLVLIAVPSSELRTYYGAGVFMMIAVISGAAVIMNMADLSVSAESERLEGLLQGLYTSVIAVMGICLSFEYIEQGANLTRINREYNERNAYIAEQAEAGVDDVIVPKLRPKWDNRFTAGYELDITDNCDSWFNYPYQVFYGVDSVTAVDREEWEAMTEESEEDSQEDQAQESEE